MGDADLHAKQDRIIRWLRRYRSAQVHERYLEEQLAKVRSQAERVTQSFSKAPGGGEMATLDRAYIKIEAAAEQYAEAMGQCLQIRTEIEQVINQVDDDNQRAVLRMTHIQGLKQQKIAQLMGYSREQISRIHASAINSLEKMSHDVTYICGIMIP